MKMFVGWVAGIAATVIGGWLLWYLTVPETPVILEGMVIDGGSNTPLPNALVIFEFPRSARKDVYHQATDEHGSYRMDIVGLKRSASVVVRAQANGFKEVPAVVINLEEPDARHDFTLMPIPGSPPRPIASTPASKLLDLRKEKGVKIVLP